MGLVLLLGAPAVEVVLVEVLVEVAPTVEVVLLEVVAAVEGVAGGEVVAALRSVHCAGAILRCNLASAVWSFGHLYLAFCNGVCTTAET